MRKIQLLTHAAVLALCCISIASCGEKYDNPVSPQPAEKRYVLAEMTESSDEGTIIYDFSYDKEGRLTKAIMQQFSSEGQKITEDISEFSYDGHLITEWSSIINNDYLYHLNDDGLLVDYEFYNYGVEKYLHNLFTYDDAHRLIEVKDVNSIPRTIVWEGDDVVKITKATTGGGMETITIEPSEVETTGFNLWDLTGSTSPYYNIIGLYGKMPKHLPAKYMLVSESIIGSAQVSQSYTYTIANGLPVGCVEEKESILDFGIVVQTQKETKRHTFVWKEI